ncbi:MAG: hypothetical protein ACRDUA_14545 [Micromonosporaceae bacterium]
MTITYSNLTRAAGVSAVASGLLYIVIQPIHPEEAVAAVTGTSWAVVAWMTNAMAILGLVGITGIYLRQVRESGVLGLIGYLMFGTFYLLVIAHSFAEALILPPLADVSPRFVDSFNGIFSGEPGTMDLGAIEAANPIAAVLYLVGGSLFGLSVFRARVLDRRAGLALTVGALAAVLAAVLPHDIGRYAAVPLGLAMIWLGYSLWCVDGKTSVTDGGAIPDARHGGSQLTPSADRS